MTARRACSEQEGEQEQERDFSYGNGNGNGNDNYNYNENGNHVEIVTGRDREFRCSQFLCNLTRFWRQNGAQTRSFNIYDKKCRYH